MWLKLDSVLKKNGTSEPRCIKSIDVEPMIADGIDMALSVTSVGLAASGVGLLSTIIAAPVAIGLQAGAIVCGLLGAGGKLVGRRLQAKARKHGLIRGLAESKLNTIADRISFFVLSYFVGFFTSITTANYSGEGGGPSQGLVAPRAIGCIRLFSAFFFSTGIPTSSYFLAASNRGWEARRPDLARKFARMGAGRLGGLIQRV